MTSVGYTVPPNYTAGSNTTQAANKNQNPNDPNMLTTGAYGNAFELALNTVTNNDRTTTDTLTYQNYAGQTNGSFSAVSETGSGGDLATAYQSLLTSMQANGETSDATASQLRARSVSRKINHKAAARMRPSPAGKCRCWPVVRCRSVASRPIRTALSIRSSTI
jgi:hypothetical protein